MMRFPRFAVIGLAFAFAIAIAMTSLRRHVVPATQAVAVAPTAAPSPARAFTTAPPAPAPLHVAHVPMTVASRSTGAGTSIPADVPSGAPAADAPAGHAGMMAAIDAEGRISPPTAAQRLALERTVPALDRSDVGLQIVRLANGAELMRLDDRFMEYAVARVDARGRVRMDCVQGPGVEGLLRRDPANAPVEE